MGHGCDGEPCRSLGPEWPTRARATVRLESPAFTPGEVQLELIWEAMQADPLKPLFWSDFAPATLGQWAELLHDDYVQAWVIHGPHGQLMGLAQVSGRRMTAWLKPLYGELDVYLLPGYRGRWAADAIRATTAYLLSQGYQNLLAYIRRDHRQSRRMAAHLGWFRVGLVPKYIPWQGVLYDAVLYSLKAPQEKA